MPLLASWVVAGGFMAAECHARGSEDAGNAGFGFPGPTQGMRDSDSVDHYRGRKTREMRNSDSVDQYSRLQLLHGGTEPECCRQHSFSHEPQP